MADRYYIEGISFETLITRALNTHGNRYPELSNLISSEDGMSFRGFRTPAKHLEKTKKLLEKALKALIKKSVVEKDCKMELDKLVILTLQATHSADLTHIVSTALDLTNKYKEQLYQGL